MKRDRLVFLVSLLIAALLGIGLGWWIRDRSDDSMEHRAHQAVEKVRGAFRSLTR